VGRFGTGHVAGVVVVLGGGCGGSCGRTGQQQLALQQVSCRVRKAGVWGVSGGGAPLVMLGGA
jgi:hypothetical protein